jgi:hypothetical protein
VLAVCAVLAAGCDGGDGATPPSGTTGTTTETETTSAETASVAVYLVRDGKVTPVRRSIPATPAVARSATSALLEGPTEDERADGLSTAIPDDASLLDIAVADGVATVDLDGSFVSDEASMRGAVAQVVATLTQFPTVERVAFRIDGEPVSTLGDVAAEQPVGRLAIEKETPQILVESPLPGDTVSSPIRLRGTANVFEATVSLEVRDESGKTVLRDFTTATSGTGTRGTFDTVLTLPDASGEVTIVAFESSAEDGRPLHVVRVPVTIARCAPPATRLPGRRQTDLRFRPSRASRRPARAAGTEIF